MYNCYKGVVLARFGERCCTVTDDSCGTIEENLILFWNSYGIIICVFCVALNSAVQLATGPANKENHFFHQIISVVFGGFSGGVLCPLVLGKPPMLLTNDYSLLWCMSVLVLTRYLPWSPFVMKCLVAKPVRLVWNNLLMITRSSTIFAITKTASSLIMANSITPNIVPVCGPIFAGVIVSCMGVFFPLTKGMKPISNGTPLVTQGALITSAFYHLYVHDTGACGSGLRWLVHCLLVYAEYIPLVIFHLAVPQHWAITGAELAAVVWDAQSLVKIDPVVKVLSTPDVCVIVVSFWFVLTSVQVLYGVNAFASFHALLYNISGVQGPRITKL